MVRFLFVWVPSFRGTESKVPVGCGFCLTRQFPAVYADLTETIDFA